MPPILRERLIWQRMTRNTNTVKITAWGAVCIWNATSIAVGRFQKERIYDLEKFIERYTHTAGDEANIYLKAPLKESAAKQPTTFADLSTLNLETVEYIKDVLKGLNDLFSVRTSSTTVKGVRDGYTAGSRKYVRHSQCMPTHRDEKGRAVCSTLPIKINSININPLKFIVMKTNKNARKNNKVQKLEKETAVKVTALAIIPKPMILL